MVMRHSLALSALLLAACGDDPCPRGAMTDSLEGLVVTEEEHPTGWGMATCAECHAFAGLHRVGCTPDMDLEAIRSWVAEDGEACCADCHGDNGVEP